MGSESSAVVIGGSVAGLTAAKVLAQRFSHVTVVDRDSLDGSARPRKGVPQGHHPHVLLASGQRALEELFPGIRDEMVAEGAVPFDPGLDLVVHRYGDAWPRVRLGMDLISFSRPLLDSLLYKRIGQLSNVTIRSGTAAGGLTGDAKRITGVVLDDGTTIEADLVVDASGRGGRSGRWLADLGCAVPSTVEVNIGVGYASRFLKRKPGSEGDPLGYFVLPTAPAKRAGILLPVEGDRWLVAMGGWHGEFPHDEEQMRTFAAELPLPVIHTALREAEPLTDFVSMTFPSSKRRYFEKLAEVPAGYVVAGDAVCSFNPIYGQGMTCASLEALALGRLLDRHGSASSELVRAYYREVATILTTPWRFAVGGDFAFPDTTGPRPRGISLLNGYSRRVQLAAKVDPEVRKTFTAVQHLVKPPSALFKPSFVLRVLRASKGSASKGSASKESASKTS